MKSSFGNAGILFPVYFVMLALAIYLNIFSGSGIDMTNCIVNLSMFLIIGFIILWSYTNCFVPLRKMMTSLYYTSQRFKTDFGSSKEFLFKKYQNEDKLFGNKQLDTRFREYCEEYDRLVNVFGMKPSLDIEDFFDDYYIDSVSKKGIISIFPGIMTGLGILGTFIGLSFGLQNFNTGTSQQITESIGPLMDGIKIAFHTSIYGMVFSLFFNVVYKKSLEDAYNHMDNFLDSYHRYVAPKAGSDSQEQTLLVMEEMLDAASTKIATKLAVAMQNPGAFQAARSGGRADSGVGSSSGTRMSSMSNYNDYQ